MEALAINHDPAPAPENIRKYFREVMEKYKLPPLPVVATKVLSMIEDPDVSLREICRVLSDDPALAARVLAVSRSAHYAQRNLPKNLQGAIQILGLRALRNLVVAAAAQGLFMTNNNVSAALWSHSLAVALASRILSQRTNSRDSEQAFLAGLLHDVGEMILFHGDAGGFERLLDQARESKRSLVEMEKESYAFDHTLIGITLLDSWNIDSEIGNAILKHHEASENREPEELATILSLADYLSFAAELGFYSEPPPPPLEIMSAFGCAGDEALAATVQELRQAFETESALFQAA